MMHEKDQSESAIDLPLSHEQRVVFCFRRDQNLWYPYYTLSYSMSFVCFRSITIALLIACLLAWDFIQS
jgi:hypothetical protein